jgi:hypothetical protein
VHATIDMAGQIRFGPDVQWLRPPACSADAEDEWAHTEALHEDYTVDPARGLVFYEQVTTCMNGRSTHIVTSHMCGAAPSCNMIITGQVYAGFLGPKILAGIAKRLSAPRLRRHTTQDTCECYVYNLPGRMFTGSVCLAREYVYLNCHHSLFLGLRDPVIRRQTSTLHDKH